MPGFDRNGYMKEYNKEYKKKASPEKREEWRAAERARTKAESRRAGSHHRASRAYGNMVWRVRTQKSYAHVRVLVPRDDFIAWFKQHDFIGGSVDRIDPKGHYELSNMQMISWGENSVKDRKLSFTATHGVCRVCKEKKALELFCKRPRNKNGRESTCKACVAKATNAYYQRKRRENLGNSTQQQSK